MVASTIKRAPTFLLKAVIIVIGLAVLAFCMFVFPQMWHIFFRELPEFSHLVYPALLGFFATAFPFFFALYQAFQLLNYIDKNTAFSELSVQALKNIKYSAITMSLLYACAMPLAAAYAQQDDAPGLILMWFAIVCAPLVVATFAAVLQKLIQNALDIKLENDLTV